MRSNASQFVRALCNIAGKKQVFTDPSDTWTYGYDNSRKHHPPDVVVAPEDTQMVQPIVALCHEHEIPITTRGRASGTTGGSIPLQGGLVLSMERLDQILEFDTQNRIMVVEPGVLNETIQMRAKQDGFFWAPDPSSAAFCTVGGNLACNAAGPRAVKYGSCRENTLGLKAVLGQGDMIECGVHTTKGVVGYDFTRLLIGSEGTLGLITEGILKLLPLPESKQTLCVMYDTLEAGIEAIVAVMSQPIVPCALEMMDDASIDLIKKHKHSLLPEKAKAMLILEVDGSAANLDHDIKTIQKVLKNKHCIDLKIARDATEAESIWQLRKALSPALRALSPHKINEDVVVPVSKMPEFFETMKRIANTYDIPIVNFGHGGNGNIHVNLLADPLDSNQGPKAHKALNELFDAVIAFHGTLSGEHGVGIEKRDFVKKEIDPTTLNLMRQVKRLFDPKGLLNPGKLLPL